MPHSEIPRTHQKQLPRPYRTFFDKHLKRHDIRRNKKKKDMWSKK